MSLVEITLAFVKAVDRARKRSLLTWDETQTKCGVARQTLSTWRKRVENQGQCAVNVQSVACLCACFGLDPLDLATGIAEPARKAVADRVAQIKAGVAQGDEPRQPGTYQVVSQFQVLDLRGPPGEFAFPAAEGAVQKVVLVDQYYFLASEELEEFTFTHATTGDGIEGECISHPNDFTLDAVPVIDPVKAHWANVLQCVHPPDGGILKQRH
jgi:hypothetical protein